MKQFYTGDSVISKSMFGANVIPQISTCVILTQVNTKTEILKCRCTKTRHFGTIIDLYFHETAVPLI